MSVKIKLGDTPKTFKSIPVTFVLADGQQGLVNVVYKYRTRTGYGAFMDEMRATAAKAIETAGGDAAALTMESMHSTATRSDADTVLGAVDSWDLDIELTRDNLALLADQAPSIIHAVVSSYRRACVEGHLGN